VQAVFRVTIWQRNTRTREVSCHFGIVFWRPRSNNLRIIRILLASLLAGIKLANCLGTMSALFKKHFWAVNLTAIAALAWSTSATVNTMVGAELFVVPDPPSIQADGEPGSLASKDLGRIPADLGAAATLEERKVFDLRPPPEGEDTEGADMEAEESETEVDATGQLEESELPIELVGTFVSEQEGGSMATLSVSGENKLGWVGTDLLDGQATLAAIAPRHIVIREGSSLKVVRLWTEKAAAGKPGRGGSGRKATSARGAARSSSSRAKPSTATKSKPPGKKDFSKGVKKTGPYDYQIDRGMLDEQLQDLSKLGSQARVVPNYRNGKYEGFKLVGVRPGSLYRSIGVRSGDVIKSVNGKAIDSPNKALELFEQLKASSSIQLEIERRGQPKQLNYAIQ